MSGLLVELILLVLAVIGVVGGFSDWHSISRTGEPAPIMQDSPANSRIASALPESGSFIRHAPAGRGEIQVSMRNGDPQDKNHCYCTFVDAAHKKAVLTVFMRANQHAVVSIPPGQYFLEYERGVHWHGIGRKFAEPANIGRTAVFTLPGSIISDPEFFVLSPPSQ